MAFVDEWSYAKSVLTFVATGHLAFYGASAMVGWQILWGALAVKLFGFSFTLLRSSMLPFAFGAVALFHACLRRFGISRSAAVLGALTLGFSPIFLPLATSFMTDTGALFGVLLCLYLCLRAIDARTSRHILLWLTVAIVTNLLLGTDRQIVWLGALIMVPSTAWLLRKRSGVLATAALLWIVSLALIRTAVHWFSHQVGVQPARLAGTLHPHAVTGMLLQFLVRAPLCLTLLVLPVAILALAHVSELSRAARLRMASTTLLAAIGYTLLQSKSHFEYAVMPWLLPLTGNLGILRTNDELPGIREVTLGTPARILISLVVIAALWAILERLWATLRARPAIPRPVAATGWQSLLYTLGPFSAVYLILLIPTELFGTGFFDRYLLFLLPLAIAAILKLFQTSARLSIPRLAYATLALTGGYVVLATHDWYALLRARLALVDRVRATGVPRTAILGGWEYDAWTQMEARGYINYRDMVRPPGQVYTTPPERKRPCERGIVDWTPAIDPQYAVVYSAMPCFAPSPFPVAEYRTWLPPFTRHLSVQRVPGYGDMGPTP